MKPGVSRRLGGELQKPVQCCIRIDGAAEPRPRIRRWNHGGQVEGTAWHGGYLEGAGGWIEGEVAGRYAAASAAAVVLVSQCHANSFGCRKTICTDNTAS